MISVIRKWVGGILILSMVFPASAAAGHEHSVSENGETGVSPVTLITSIGSGIFVSMLILRYLLRARLHEESTNKMPGMMAAMTVAMGSSLIIGTIAGILLTHMFFSTVIGVLFGMFVGYTAGYIYSLLAAMEGMLAGLMGGMMGAMLGVMVNNEYPTLSILFMDLVFAFCMTVLYRLLGRDPHV